MLVLNTYLKVEIGDDDIPCSALKTLILMDIDFDQTLRLKRPKHIINKEMCLCLQTALAKRPKN